MWNLIPSILVLLVASANGQLPSDYELWLDGQNITSGVSESSTDLNASICAADQIKVNKKMEELDVSGLQCSIKLNTLVADNIGLLRITNASIGLLPQSVQNLTIVRNNLRKINSGIFSNSTLEYLNLSSNKIEIVAPDALDYMKNLTSLIIDHNEITTYNLTFVECHKLKLISLQYNFIKQLSEGIFRPLKHNILTVFLSYNNIKEAHKSALDIKQFQEVHLDHNELSNAQLLIKLVKAELVDLSENHITCLPKEFMENGLSKIKMLNLSAKLLQGMQVTAIDVFKTINLDGKSVN